MWCGDVAHVREYDVLTNVLQLRRPITGVSSLADRLKEARQRKGWSQADLARHAGVKPGTIGNVESGTRKSPRELLQIARVLEVAPQWLQDGRDPPVWKAQQHPDAGVRFHPVAQEMSQRYGDDSRITAAAVPVHFTGRMTAAGGITLERLDSGGVVGAAFVGPMAYAVRVVGDALHPVVRHGSYIVCDPAAPPIVGELVLVQLRDGTAALRELLVQREAELTTSAVMGGHRETTTLAEIERVDPVVMIVSSSRWRQA